MKVRGPLRANPAPKHESALESTPLPHSARPNPATGM